MGILQARILKWVSMPSSRESSRSRDWTQVSCIAGRFFTIWATREAHDKPSQYIKKQRHHCSNNVHIVKAMVFPVGIYGCESWTTKKAEPRIIDAFELWCWRRFWRVPSTARRSNPSLLKEVNPEYSLEGLMVKLQYFDHLMWRADFLEKTLMHRKIERRRRRGQQRTRWLDSITDSMDMNLSKPWK